VVRTEEAMPGPVEKVGASGLQMRVCRLASEFSFAQEVLLHLGA
jgi:hypothetical protein